MIISYHLALAIFKDVLFIQKFAERFIEIELRDTKS